ncbi:RICIN domain-containing protein [Kitasatospora sp. NPDC002227]|uniref:RICIN domain-containing protein n=1 Tax=Kitasatospora sp. NPDC002227 TaxID=3154773 RepID=UPI00331CC2AC
MKKIRNTIAATALAAAALAGTMAVSTPAQAAVPNGWVHVQNVGTGQYLDDYAHNTSQGAAVYTWPQSGQSNQWWYVTMTSTNTVVFSSYETQSCANLLCDSKRYENLRRGFSDTAELSESNVWYNPYDNTATRARWWYAAGDAGAYIHSADGDQGCLTAHPWGQATIEGCRTGDHSQQWNVVYS